MAFEVAVVMTEEKNAELEKAKKRIAELEEKTSDSRRKSVGNEERGEERKRKDDTPKNVSKPDDVGKRKSKRKVGTAETDERTSSSAKMVYLKMKVGLAVTALNTSDDVAVTSPNVNQIVVGSRLRIWFEEANQYYPCKVTKIDGNKYSLLYDDTNKETMIRIDDVLYEWKESLGHVDANQKERWKRISMNEDNLEVVEKNPTIWMWEGDGDGQGI